MIYCNKGAKEVKQQFVIDPDFVTKLNLKGVQLLLYTRISNFDYRPHNYFKIDSLKSFSDCIEVDFHKTLKALKKLMNKGLVEAYNDGIVLSDNNKL